MAISSGKEVRATYDGAAGSATRGSFKATEGENQFFTQEQYQFRELLGLIIADACQQMLMY